MGSQRRIAEALTANFDISEDKAYTLVPVIERTQIGDDLYDAVYLLAENGDVDDAIANLTRLHRQLGESIGAIRDTFGNLERRREPVAK